MSGTRRQVGLERLFRLFGWIAVVAIGYVLLDFAIDLRPPGVQDSYFFRLDPLRPDEIRILNQDNLSLVVIRRSAATIARLRSSTDRLQDPGSVSSSQPAYAANLLRSRDPEYFVSYGLGTDLGCRLEVVGDLLQEICGEARYDFAGRALKGDNTYPNLTVPDYRFGDNFENLTVEP